MAMEGRAMDALKAQLTKIQQQLSGLTASQKMLTAALAAIMVMTLLWWGRYASTADMVAVLDQSMRPEDVTRIKTKLTSVGIDTRVDGDRVMVPADKKDEAVALLAFDQLLPEDISSAMSETLKDLNPFTPSEIADKQINAALEKQLATYIRRMPGVGNAGVVLPTDVSRPYDVQSLPTASITVQMRDGTKPDNKLAYGIAGLVRGARPGLDYSRINLIFDGRPFHLDDRAAISGGAGGEVLEREQEAERAYQQKVKDQLGYFGPNVLAAVKVRINNKLVNTESNNVTDIKTKESETEHTEETQNAPAAPAAEPGVLPNTGIAVTPAPSPEQSEPLSTSSKDRSKYQVEPSRTKEVTQDFGGDAQILSADVRVPRSYFVRIAKKMSSSGSADDKTVQSLIESELPKIVSSVRNVLSLREEGTVTVDTYMDDLPDLAAAATVEAASSPMTLSLGDHVKEIAVGALAIISLFMVAMMVRKSAPQPIIAAPMELAEAPALSGGEDIAGEAVEGNPMLDGMELDEDAIKAQQMVEQVATMVKENPDAAANLVKRWLNRT
jgi:flagellar biosynthesis/type III secretory pathway M-ring protein FliF/YscJ